MGFIDDVLESDEPLNTEKYIPYGEQFSEQWLADYNQKLADEEEAKKQFEIQQAQAAEPTRSNTGEVLTGLKTGFVDVLPEQFYGSLAAFAPEGSSVEQWFLDKRKEQQDDMQLPSHALQPERHGSIINALASGAESTPSSLAAGALTAITPYIGIPATVALFGGSSYQDTYEEVLKDTGDKEKAHEAGLKVAAIQGGGEVVASLIGAKFLKGALLGAKPNTIMKALSKLKNPNAVKAFAKDVLEVYGTEISTEIGQDVSSAIVTSSYTGKDVDYLGIAKETGAATAGMTTLMLPFGAIGHIRRTAKDKKLVSLVEDGKADPTERMVSALVIYDKLSKVDKVSADKWSASAMNAIAENKSFDIVSEESQKTEPVKPKTPAEKVVNARQQAESEVVSSGDPLVDKIIIANRETEILQKEIDTQMKYPEGWTATFNSMEQAIDQYTDFPQEVADRVLLDENKDGTVTLSIPKTTSEAVPATSPVQTEPTPTTAIPEEEKTPIDDRIGKRATYKLPIKNDKGEIVKYEETSGVIQEQVSKDGTRRMLYIKPDDKQYRQINIELNGEDLTEDGILTIGEDATSPIEEVKTNTSKKNKPETTEEEVSVYAEKTDDLIFQKNGKPYKSEKTALNALNIRKDLATQDHEVVQIAENEFAIKPLQQTKVAENKAKEAVTEGFPAPSLAQTEAKPTTTIPEKKEALKTANTEKLHSIDPNSATPASESFITSIKGKSLEDNKKKRLYLINELSRKSGLVKKKAEGQILALDDEINRKENPAFDEGDIAYQLSKEDREQINKDLEAKLKKTLEKHGVQVKELETLKNKYGVDALGVADAINKIVNLKEDRDISTLPEETAHIIMSLSGDKKIQTQLNKLRMNIKSWDGFAAIQEEYKDVYGTEVEVNDEAVAKLIAESIINKGKKTALHKRVINLVKDFINWIKATIGNEVAQNKFAADKIAQRILKGKTGETVKTKDSIKFQKQSDKYSVDEKITKLPENEIFVFGSNEAGRHGKGAAKVAKDKFGAIYGQGVGEQGQSYAIPTKNKNLKTLSLSQVKKYVSDFLAHAAKNPDKIFNVTAIGTGLAGFKAEEIAPLFKDSPNNVKLPKKWANAEAKPTVEQNETNVGKEGWAKTPEEIARRDARLAELRKINKQTTEAIESFNPEDALGDLIPDEEQVYEDMNDYGSWDLADDTVPDESINVPVVSDGKKHVVTFSAAEIRDRIVNDLQTLAKVLDCIG